jgi:L-iditol 2-dehydrogenase
MINKYLIYKNKSLELKKKKIILKKKHILVKIKSCGICGSDVKILKGKNKRIKNGRVIGHEISGQICRIFNKKIIATKKKILFGADISNPDQKDYALGHEIDGGFQNYLQISNSLLKNLPHKITTKNIKFDEGSMCEPLACVLNGFEKIRYDNYSDIIIFGNGPMGNLIATYGLYLGSKRILIVDSNLSRLKCGIKNKFIQRASIEKINNIKDIIKFKYGFLACNSTEAQNNILKYINKGGFVNLFAGVTYKKDLPKINTNFIHYNEISMVGSHGSKKNHVIKAANLIINKKINLKGIITNKYKLHDYKKAFLMAANQRGLKIIINP